MFKQDQSGNVAMIFALMLPVLMAATGGGIEVSRAIEYKQRLTSAVDLACNQAQVYAQATIATAPQTDFSKDARFAKYGTDNLTQRNLGSSGSILLTPTKSSTDSTQQNKKPGNVLVAATGSIDLVFKSFLNKKDMSFTVVRNCAVESSSPAVLLVSESFEGYTSQLKGGWGVFGTMSAANCTSSICQDSQGKAKSWGTTNAGVEVDQLSAVTTGDGVQYGQAFAELDSDCSNRVGATNQNQTNACNDSGQTTNSSINMPLTLPAGTYEVRYVYTARKNVGNYQYPNDDIICSKPSDTDGTQRNNDVAKNAAGSSTTSLDGQTRRIELWVEPSSSGYKSDDKNITTDYMKNYMADVCVWSKSWTERSYKFTVASKQDYRISWRAGGLDDSFGGLIDYLRVCQNSCP